jgi:cell division cycle protein 20 (cofactor of APC complex)
VKLIDLIYFCNLKYISISYALLIQEGNILGVGDSEGTIQLWDVASTKLVRTMTGHTDRITSLDWNAHILASGGRTGAIHLHDVRVANHHVGTLTGHTQVNM